jgi:threonine synthase
VNGGLEAVRGLRCVGCGRLSAPEPIPYVCAACGQNQLVEYDLDRVARAFDPAALAADPERSIWRYRALLPVSRPLAGPPVGWTPLVDAPILAASVGVREVLVKDEGRNPSASLKDRASAVALAHARDAGRDLVIAASTGNAAAATATLAAPNGLKARIFVPRSAPRAKLAQLQAFGAEVLAVDGTYDDAFELSLAATRRFGWYNRNTGFNPITREGKKTVAFELWEQLGYRVPDVVVVPVGDGNILSGVWKGFVELHALGLAPTRPRLFAVQAEGSASVADAVSGDGLVKAVSGKTVADSISVCLPRDGLAAVRAVRESGGAAVVVSDDDILAGIPALARASGVFAEPAGAAAYAGLVRAAASGLLAGATTVVLLSTGSGLKDVGAVLRTAGEPRLVSPDPARLGDLFPT